MSALVVRNFGEVALSVTAEAMLLRSQALEQASQISVVSNAVDQKLAVEAIATVRGLIKKMEESRVMVKKPVLDFGSKIDAQAKDYKASLEKEATRLNNLVQEHFREETRRAAARKKFADDIAERKRAREAEEARAAQEEADRIHAQAQGAATAQEALELTAQAQASEQVASQAAERAETIAPAQVAAPVKASGMIAREIWKHEVVDIAALYAARPDLVTLEPRTLRINAAIAETKAIPGLRIWKEIDTTVRAK